MASPALDEAIAARFAPPFHAWYDVTHDGPPGREHKGRVEKQARYGLGAIAAHAAGGPRLAGAWGSLEACSGAETGLRSASWPKPDSEASHLASGTGTTWSAACSTAQWRSSTRAWTRR